MLPFKWNLYTFSILLRKSKDAEEQIWNFFFFKFLHQQLLRETGLNIALTKFGYNLILLLYDHQSSYWSTNEWNGCERYKPGEPTSELKEEELMSNVVSIPNIWNSSVGSCFVLVSDFLHSKEFSIDYKNKHVRNLWRSVVRWKIESSFQAPV